MTIVARRAETVNLADPAAWRAWVESLSVREYASAFGVKAGARAFVCPTTGRTYFDLHPIEQNDHLWTRCRCCDGELHVLGEEGYDPRNPQRHLYPIIDEV